MTTRRPSQWLRYVTQPPPMIGIVIIVICWIGLAYQLHIEHAKSVDTAIERGGGLARLFEENTIRLLNGVDRTLVLLRVAYEENPEQFDLGNFAERTSLLGDLTIQVAIIDADGYLKASTSDYTGSRIYLGDREHFQVHVGDKPDELFIGKPVVGRASGKLSIQLSRRIRKPDGSFGGVIFSSIDPGFVGQFHSSIKLGEYSGVSLRGLDGVVRAAAGFSAADTYKDSLPKALADALANTATGHYWPEGSTKRNV